jgi:hypothetical protein
MRINIIKFTKAQRIDPGVHVRVLLPYELKEHAHKRTGTAKCYSQGKLNYTESLGWCLEV